MEKLIAPGLVVVMFLAHNEILSLSILLGFGIWFIIQIGKGY